MNIIAIAIAITIITSQQQNRIMVLHAFERALNIRDEDPRRDGVGFYSSAPAQVPSSISMEGGARARFVDENDIDQFGDYGDFYDPEFDQAVSDNLTTRVSIYIRSK
jgi:hypothetical protein